MRDYINKLRGSSDLRVIKKEVAAEFELAALIRLSQQRDDKALLFQQVSGSSMPVVSNIYGSRRRLCELLGAKDGNFCHAWDQLSRQLDKEVDIDFPVTADNRVNGKLSDLPAIRYFEKDAGPYFTSAIFMAKHPETAVHNLSFHRAMYIDNYELRIRLGSTHDLYNYFDLAEKQGKALPAAMLIGTNPEIFVSACASLEKDEDELQMASILKGKPVDLINCQEIDLRVPRDTEIIIEGQILPGLRRPEGPFGEFMGYYVPIGDNHVFEVLNVSWREKPYFHALLCGSPEDIYPLDYATASRIYRKLTREMKGIINVACYPYIMNTIIQVHKESDEQVRGILMAAVNANHDYSKTCMVVDEDVDIYDLNDVWWAYLTRGRADTRAEIIHDLPGFYRDENRDHWGRLLIDATKPLGRLEEFERKTIPGLNTLDLDAYL